MTLENVEESHFRALAETGEASNLMMAFWWVSAPEGAEYWCAEYERGKELSPEAWEKVRMMYVEWVVCDRDRDHEQD